MHNNNYKTTSIDTNECTSRGACSIAPNISALQELIMYFLKQLAYYILKLENMGANNKSIKYEIINDIAALVSINEFNEEQLYSIITKDYFLLEDTKKTYKKHCKKENIECLELKNHIDFDNSTTLPKAISLGEKLFLEQYNRLTTEQKNHIEILLIVIKSVSLNILKLNDFDEFDEDMYHQVLQTLDLLNERFQLRKINKQIVKLAEADNKLQLKIGQMLLEKFGGIENVKVSHSTEKGKAILVSGSNFMDLLNILEETKDKNIDI
ncbi:hypothetical protein HDR58_08405, partial [bacterium]|nr:hypothetical protein [bacterium]